MLFFFSFDPNFWLFFVEKTRLCELCVGYLFIRVLFTFWLEPGVTINCKAMHSRSKSLLSTPLSYIWFLRDPKRLRGAYIPFQLNFLTFDSFNLVKSNYKKFGIYINFFNSPILVIYNKIWFWTEYPKAFLLKKSEGRYESKVPKWYRLYIYFTHKIIFLRPYKHMLYKTRLQYGCTKITFNIRVNRDP